MARKCAMAGCESNTTKGALCFRHRPRKPIPAKKRYIKPESEKAHTARLKVLEEWFDKNPADAMHNTWYCYLDGLSEHCWYIVTKEQILEFGLEHVVPKVKSREKKFDVDNLRAACQPCNKEKGSQTIEQLFMRYEHWGGPRS